MLDPSKKFSVPALVILLLAALFASALWQSDVKLRNASGGQSPRDFISVQSIPKEADYDGGVRHCGRRATCGST